MTEQEVESGNEKIELHNKFCFMKKKLPKYKKIVSLSEAFVYIMIAACLLAMPTFFSLSFSLSSGELQAFKRPGISN